MSLKLFGAVLIVAACGGVGWSMAAAHRREENALHQLVGALELMKCELQQNLQPLPQLCRMAAEQCSGTVGQAFQHLAKELEDQISPNAAICMDAAINATPKLTKLARNALEKLGHSLGRFDLMGQLDGLEAVKLRCQSDIEDLSRDRDRRLRSYQTLGLCTGAALAILFL